MPLWRPQLFPATVIVTDAPAGFTASSFPGPTAPGLHSKLIAEGLHTAVTDDQGDHRVWLPHGERPVDMAFVIPRDQHFLWRIRNVMRLHRFLDGELSGAWPRAQRLTRFQRHRASLMLRAWDGIESGASRRHVAAILLNPDVASLRVIDWKNAPERRRLARILKAARETIEGGYLRWLTPRIRDR